MQEVALRLYRALRLRQALHSGNEDLPESFAGIAASCLLTDSPTSQLIEFCLTSSTSIQARLCALETLRGDIQLCTDDLCQSLLALALDGKQYFGIRELCFQLLEQKAPDQTSLRVVLPTVIILTRAKCLPVRLAATSFLCSIHRAVRGRATI